MWAEVRDPIASSTRVSLAYDDELAEAHRDTVHHELDGVPSGVVAPRGELGERDAAAKLDAGHGLEVQLLQLEDLGAGLAVSFYEMHACVDHQRLALCGGAHQAELEAHRVADARSTRLEAY